MMPHLPWCLLGVMTKSDRDERETPMTNAMNHEAEAQTLADVAAGIYGHIEHRDGDAGVSEGVEALMIATVAQVHATLALVQVQRTVAVPHVHATMALVEAQRESNEQARIANLIALMGAEFTVPDSDYLEVIAEIRKRLGL